MSKALEREKLLFDLWSRKQVLSTDTVVLETLGGLHSKGYISSMESPALTDEGLEYILHGRGPSELVELLSDLNVSEDERIFLANAIREMADKPFAYEIIKNAIENPNREKYPSVYLGAYEDIEHGVLFCAGTHIMIDPKLGKNNIERIIKKLEKFGAVVTEDQQKGYGAHVLYKIGDAERELYLVGTEAMKIDRNIWRRKIERGIFALIMKGKEDYNTGFADILNALKHYSQFLIEGGIALTSRPLINTELKKVGEGVLEYWTHLGHYKLSTHNLYQKQIKG